MEERPGKRLLLMIRRLDPAERQGGSHTCPNVGQAFEEVADERSNQAPSPHRDGCRTFLDPRAEERRGAANASC